MRRDLDVVPTGNSRRALAPHEPHPISNQLVGSVFHTVRSGIDTGYLRFLSRVVGVADIRKDSDPGMEHYVSQVWRNRDIAPQGHLSPRAWRPPIGRERARGDPRPINGVAKQLGLEIRKRRL